VWWQVFTARYRLIPYIKQITFRLLKVNHRGQGNNIIIIGSTALGGPWPPQANVASDLYPGHSPAATTILDILPRRPLSWTLSCSDLYLGHSPAAPSFLDILPQGPLTWTFSRSDLYPGHSTAATSILDILPPISTTQFPCVFLYPVDPS
jgi:hypothetical protein